MGEKRRHHTVPRVYLQYFSTERQHSKYVWVYDKSSGRIYEQNINNVTVKNKFYTLELSENRNAWEDYYAEEVEPKLGNILRVLKQQAEAALVLNRANILTDTSKAELSVQMAYQMRRGRTAREQMLDISEEVLPDIISEAAEKYGITKDPTTGKDVRDFKPSEKLIKAAIAEASVDRESIIKIATHLIKRYWVIYRITGNAEFVTSDNPVLIITNSINETTPFSNGLVNPKTTVLYPISSTLLIVLYSDKYLGGALQLFNDQIVFIDAQREKEFIDSVNIHQAQQCYQHVIAKSKNTLRFLA